MSEPRLISPLLDDFIMGDPISDHHGICCCPAIKNGTEDKYIVKIISIPASQAQMDALLLSGAFSDETAALAYYQEIVDDTVAEIGILKGLSEQEGFTPYDAWQIEPMENGKGYEIYLLRSYNRTLDRHFKRHSFTHLDALNLGLDICAALSVSRRSGYLYVGLKPANVFVTDQHQYKIGGLGFIRMDSLKYASLPEKYRSIYTPAEVSDAYSALNPSMDIYAAGLILYQAYNNGALPFCDDVQPGDRLPPPLYADYEMSEIILKACDPDPAIRWQDPMQMGQAIISYMQRNGAKDTPIVPVPASEADSHNDSASDAAEIDSAETDMTVIAEHIVEESGAETSNDNEEFPTYVEDEFGNFFFLSDVSYEDLGLSGETKDYETLSGEVSEILNQADELATLTVPEPVIVPDHIDLPELEPIVVEPEEESNEESSVQASEDAVAAEEVPECIVEQESSPEVTAADMDDEETEEDTPPTKRKSHWLRDSILVLVILGVLTCGYFFYTNYYLLHINAITIDGSNDSLIVRISTEADESLLQVICVDTYGNQIPSAVVNGEAEFTNLVPNTAYSIKVVSSGLHRVSGQVKASYSTPVQTNIALFDAITGATDGSVILNFTVEGPDSKAWKVVYSADGEDVRSESITEHRVVLSGLTIGKEYTFRLVPAEELYLSGQEEIRFTARRVVKAENLEIVSCMDRTMVVKWSSPADETVSNWTVSCNGVTYNKTVTTTDTTVTFTDLDHTGSYIVEVKANYMSVGEKISLAANTATVTDFKANVGAAGTLEISWNTSLPVPADGWLLNYSIVGIDNAKFIPCDDNTAVIDPVIPNASYRIWLTDAKNEPLLSGVYEYKTGAAPDFTQKIGDVELNRGNLRFQLCKLHSIQNWNGLDLSEVEFTSSFASAEAAAFLVTTQQPFTPSDDPVAILFLIRDQDGKPVYTTTANSTWTQIWSQDFCKLSIPAMPTAAGSYTIEVYFNGGLAASNAFTIT